MTITEFILARVAEDEGQARAAFSGQSDPENGWGQYGRAVTPHVGIIHEDTQRAHVVKWNPKRVLAECKAKRAIVERHVPDRQLENWYWLERKCSECGKTWHKWLPNRLPTDIGPEQGCPTLRALAAIYAAHPDYDESWTL